MNRLKGQIAYVSGAIDRAPDLGKGWRDKITPALEKFGITIFNPLEKPIKGANETDFRVNREHWKQNEEWSKLAEVMKEIRHCDLRLCDKADFGIFYLDLNIYATGTMEELFTMNRQYKPCLVVCEQSKAEIPDWLWGALPEEYMFGSFSYMFDYLRKIDKSKKKLKRWVFFN